MIERRAVAIALASVAAVAALGSGRAPAQGARYQHGRASADGTGKRYMGREIAQVMGWQGAAWLEREEREREERTSLLIGELGLQAGQVVADIGAGTGYIARRLAVAVGPTGRVDAVDVQPEMIRLLADSSARAGLANVRPILGADDDVRLPVSSVDPAIMVDVYHELAFPFEVLTSVARAVRPNGRVVLVEYRAEDPAVPIKALHKMSVAQIRKEVESVQGLAFDRVAGRLPWQHVVIFRRL